MGHDIERRRSSLLKATTPPIARLIGVILGVGGLLGLTDLFKVTIFEADIHGLLFAGSVALNIWLALELSLHSRPKLEIREIERSFADGLIRETRRLYELGDYPAVLRHRESFSRLLWLEGHLEHRVKLGDVAEDAATQLGDSITQAAALIDDLGWTSVAQKRYEIGEGYLRHGLRIARESKSAYWEAKALRHLCGLQIELGDYSAAYRHLDDAVKAAQAIVEETPRREMLAGIEYGYAITAYSGNDLDRALKHLKKSDALRQDLGDASRTIRVYAMMGKILEAKGDYLGAKDNFRRGLRASRDMGRRDEEIRNLLGLARVLKKEYKLEEANEFISRANELMENTPIPWELGVNELLHRQATNKRGK